MEMIINEFGNSVYVEMEYAFKFLFLFVYISLWTKKLVHAHTMW
jgi:hypothetical protein